MVGKHRSEKPLKHLRISAVFIHADFLRNDPPLFFHALFGKMRRVDHIQQNLKIFLHVVGTLHIVGRDIIAGKGVGTSAKAGKALHGVFTGHIEHFMLQVVGNTLRAANLCAIHGKRRVNGAVVHGQEAIGLGKARFWYHAHQQAAGKPCLIDPLAQGGIRNHSHTCTPLRKYTLSNRRVLAASTTCSLVTAAICRAKSSMAPCCPATACPTA